MKRNEGNGKRTQYRLRGWPQLAFLAVFILLGVLLSVFTRHKTAFLYLLPGLLSQLPLFVQERRLTERQWRAQQSENDERFRLVRYKAGAISAMILEAIAGIALAWVALFREGEDLALLILSVIFCAGALSFCIAQTVLNRRT